MILHRLDGCAPAPLAHYLKALGILRLVSEQADSHARGWWEGERFLLATHLDEEELTAFFLERYAPTPLVAPWNKGSGFFYQNDPALTPLENSSAPRFENIRAGIAASRALLGKLASADQLVRDIKAETKEKELSKVQREALRKDDSYKKRLAEAERQFKQLKADFIPQLRLCWRGAHRDWLDAAMVLNDQGEPQFPALLGTGGNDGRLDFTNNFFQKLGEVFDLGSAAGEAKPIARTWFKNALLGSHVATYRSGAVGQFAPGAAGGPNSSVGVDGSSSLNPVDFLLMLEGAVLFSAHATRRLGTQTPSRASAPFAIASQGAGYASASESDEGARGEQWMPLWSQPTTLSELQRLLAEGRAQLGKKSAGEPLDMARSVASLGIARGIKAFQRYGYIERNGQSNLAVPIGRFQVPEQPSLRLSCLDDLDSWLSRLRRAARDKGSPNRLKMAEKQLTDALFAVVQHPDEPARWQMVVLALSRVEAVLLSMSKVRCGPLPGLRPEWVAAADDGSAEWRLAVSFALQNTKKDWEYFGPVRRHWVPKKNQETAAVMQGRRGIDDAIAVLERRLIEAAQHGLRKLPLEAACRAGASLPDIAALLTGHLDIDRILAFSRTLMAVKQKDWVVRPVDLPGHEDERWPDEGWMIIRLAMLPWPLNDGLNINTDPAVFRRLASGDAATAIELALRRLRSAGVKTSLRFGVVSPNTAHLWAAALAFPITKRSAQKMLNRISSTTLTDLV